MDRWKKRIASGLVPSLLITSFPGCIDQSEVVGVGAPSPAVDRSEAKPGIQPVRAALRATQGELGKQLAVMNGLSAFQNGASPRILGELLTTTLEHRASVPSDASKPWMERLIGLNPDAWVRGASGLFDSDLDRVLDRVLGVELGDEHPALNSLNLLRELDVYRSKVEKFGAEVAEKEFLERLEEWAPEILQAANGVYLEDGAQAYREAFRERVQKPLEKFSRAGVRVDASLEELSRSVPGELPEIARLKKQLADGVIEKAKKLSSSEKAQKAIELAHSTFQWVNTVNEALRREKEAPRAHQLQRRAEVAVRLAGLFADQVLKQPQVARKIEMIGGTAIRLAGLIRQFKAGEVGSQLLTGNFLGAAKGLLEGLGVLQLGNDQQAVLSAIEGIQKSLNEFRAEMNLRLDGIDKKLDGIAGKLDQQLELLKEQKIVLIEIQNEIAQIEVEVLDLGVLIQSGFNDGIEREYQSERDRCFGGVNKEVKLSDQALVDCLNFFFRAAVHGSNQTSRGSVPVQSVDVYLKLTRGEREFRLGGYALGYRLAGIEGKLESQANVWDWVRSSESFHSLLMKTASGLDLVNPEKLEELVSAGRKIQRTLQWMGSTSTLRTVLEQYDRSLQAALECETKEACKQWIDRARVARAVLDQSLRLTRPTERTGRADLVRLFETEEEGFPGEDLLLGLLRQQQDKKELGRRKGAAVAAFKVYLDGREQGSAGEVSSTLVDDSLARLDQLVQAQKSKKE